MADAEAPRPIDNENGADFELDVFLQTLKADRALIKSEVTEDRKNTIDAEEDAESGEISEEDPDSEFQEPLFITKPKLEKLTSCEICKEKPSKYRCPGCYIQTCSVECSKQHKEEDGCSGQRNRTAYVSLQNFDDTILRSDIEFLKDMGDLKDRKRREISRNPRELPPRLKALVAQTKERNIHLQIMPFGMQRRKQNNSFYHFGKKTLLWTVEFSFEGEKILLDRIAESNTLSEAFDEASKSSGGLKEKLDALKEEVSFLYRDPQSRANDLKYFQFKGTDVLGDSLRSKEVIEFPTFLLVPKSSLSSFKIIPNNAKPLPPPSLPSPTAPLPAPAPSASLTSSASSVPPSPSLTPPSPAPSPSLPLSSPPSLPLLPALPVRTPSLSLPPNALPLLPALPLPSPSSSLPPPSASPSSSPSHEFGGRGGREFRGRGRGRGDRGRGRGRGRGHITFERRPIVDGESSPSPSLPPNNNFRGGDFRGRGGRGQKRPAPSPSSSPSPSPAPVASRQPFEFALPLGPSAIPPHPSPAPLFSTPPLPQNFNPPFNPSLPQPYHPSPPQVAPSFSFVTIPTQSPYAHLNFQRGRGRGRGPSWN